MRVNIGASAAAGVLFAIILMAGCSEGDKTKTVYDFFSKPAGFESYFATTEDGWQLSLFRYKPALIDNRKAPVILCHGLSYNNYFWDIDKDYSLAQYLADRGHDTWSVSLRGAGRSTKSGFTQTWDIFDEDAFGSVVQQIFDARAGEETREAARVAFKALMTIRGANGGGS